MTTAEDWQRVLPKVENPVTDHEYFGNICSGFGAPTTCEMANLDTGTICGRQPHEHQPPRHKSDQEDGFGRDHWGYEPKHRA